MENQSEHFFEVYYSPLDTELLGRLWIAAQDDGALFLDFAEDEDSFIASLSRLTKDFPGQMDLNMNPTRLSSHLEALCAFFDWRAPISKDLQVNLNTLGEFQRAVLEVVRELPLGSTSTYGEIAKILGNEGASRAVGQALRANPLPIIIPCHRVLLSDGSVGGYGGILGSDRKIALLKHEGVILA